MFCFVFFKLRVIFFELFIVLRFLFKIAVIFLHLFTVALVLRLLYQGRFRGRFRCFGLRCDKRVELIHNGLKPCSLSAALGLSVCGGAYAVRDKLLVVLIEFYQELHLLFLFGELLFPFLHLSLCLGKLLLCIVHKRRRHLVAALLCRVFRKIGPVL